MQIVKISTRVRRYLLVLSVAGAVAGNVSAQSAPARATAAEVSDVRTTWLKKHAAAVRSVDITDNDFSDLQALKAAIGDARIVGLGDRGPHGDGTTWLARGRIVRFLHEQMGFDVILFEAGFYDAKKAWERSAREDPYTSLQSALFPNVTKTLQGQKLLRYIASQARSTHPLEIGGMDCQLTGTASREFLVEDMRRFLAGIGVSTDRLQDGSPFVNSLLGMSAVEGFHDPNDEFLPSLLELHRLVEAQLAARHPADGEFWLQVFKNLEAEAAGHVESRMMQQLSADWQKLANFSNEVQRRIDPTFPAADAKDLRSRNLTSGALATDGRGHRDPQMADNVMWLLRNRYAGKKVIIWAAGYHLGFGDGDSWLVAGRPPVVNMGKLLRRQLGSSLYVVSFTAYEGKSHNPFNVPNYWGEYRPSPRPGIEDSLASAGFDFAFVDLRHPQPGGEWLQQRFASRSAVSDTVDEVWRSITDAFFFIKHMEPMTAGE